MRDRKKIITLCVCCMVVLSLILGTDIKKREVIASIPNTSQTDSKSVTVKSKHNKYKTNKYESKSSGDKLDKEEKLNDRESKFKDGEYTGSAQGYKGEIKVSVKVESGKISSIDILSNSDDEEYFVNAKKVTDEIISSQDTNVSTISGATFSSNGIINAVSNALSGGA